VWHTLSLSTRWILREGEGEEEARVERPTCACEVSLDPGDPEDQLLGSFASLLRVPGAERRKAERERREDSGGI
jgi:hypothetical protein